MITYYMPVKVLDGPDVVLKNGKLIAGFGKKALIVTGRSSARKNGSYQDICRTLEEQGVMHALFDQVEENPSVATIMKARDYGLKENVDFVIGIGGGSPMDAAKAIALMIRHKDADAGYLYDPEKPSDTIPIIEIPTTCGTGSEVTAVSVLTVPEKGTKISMKHKVFPDLALIDGKYLKTAPASIRNCTAFDALSHMIESCVNVKVNDYTMMCIDAGLRLWSKSQPILRGEKEPADQDLTDMMRASMMAGMSIAQGGTTIPHGLSYPLTFCDHIPHGKAAGYFTAGYLAETEEATRSYILKTAGFTDLKDYQDLYTEACGVPEVSDDLLHRAVEEVSANQAKLSAVPFACSRETLERIAFYTKNHRG